MRLGIWAGAAALVGLAATACKSDVQKPPEKAKCGYHSDCDHDGVCYLGECHPTVSCFERANCATAPICADDRCICDQASHRCFPVCVTDNDCASDGYCLNGVCTPYPVAFDGAPLPSGERGRLMVGLGRVPLDFPMGVSMAGYGSRIGPRTPYQETLGGSNAWFDRPDARAIVFSDGKETAVLLRISTSWSADFMLADTARKVQERTGVNILDDLITSANHSHSLPARWWHLVDGLAFGFFGYGEFSYEVFDRMTTTYADAVVMALDDLQPARLGYVVLDDFDPDDRIHHDRRNRNDNLPGYLKKDDRMLLMRVDDDSGEPIAFLTNFGMHGTVFDYDNPMITGDAGTGVEMALTEEASRKYGHPILGFYLQGNAGDQSPSGGDRGHTHAEQLQVIGRRAWDVMEPELDAIQTSDQIQVGIFDGRIPISHDILGYGDGEFYDSDVSCDDTPPYFRYGAFQCVDGYLEDEDPSTAFSDGDLACVFGIECLTGGYPVPEFQKTHLSVLRLGTLALPTMPGEPVSQFGRDAAARVKDAIPGVTDAVTLGYSQDHHFYLLNEDDWFQGGYEPSRDIWGWKLAPYLVTSSVQIAAELAKEPEARTFPPNGNLKPMYWVDPEEKRQTVPFTETEGDPAEILEDIPAEVERLDEVTLAWSGGHPGLDLPVIVLEREDGGTFGPVTKPGGLLYDDSGFEMIVMYEGHCSRKNCDSHRWRVRWQERRDFPLGRYRLSVHGLALKNGAVTNYETASRSFEVVASKKLHVYGVAATADGIEGRVADPPLLNAFLMRSIETPGAVGAAVPIGSMVRVAGTVRPAGGAAEAIDGTATLEQVTEARDRLTGFDDAGAPTWSPAGSYTSARFRVDAPAIAGGPAGDYHLELTVTDDGGNAGTFTATVTK